VSFGGVSFGGVSFVGASAGSDHLPDREGDVLDPVVHLGPAGPAELSDAGLGRFEAEYSFEVGDRHEERSVGVARPEDGVDPEHGVSGITRVDARAVVDDPFEDRQRPQSHATMLADDPS
jgi:hypothetical protein